MKPKAIGLNSLFLLSFLLWTPLNSQEFYLSHYTTDDGLLSNSVNVVFQDSMDQIWIGTDGGLYIFNGVNFIQVKKGIPSNYIRDIENIDGRDIALSHDAGISIVKPLFHDFKVIENLDNFSLNNQIKYPNRLFSDSKDRLWISQPDGALVRFAEKDIEFILKENLNKKEVNIHYSFSSLNNADFFISSPQGQHYLWSEEEQELKKIGRTTPVEDIQYFDGLLYIAGEELTVADYNKTNQKLEIIWQTDELNTKYTSIASDSLGRVFIGTNGFGLFQLINHEKSYYIKEVFSNNDPHRVDKLPLLNINSIYISEDNSIWVSSEQGIGLLQRRFFEGAQNLPNDNATTLALAENGDVYVCMGDVYKIKKEGQEYRAKKLNLPNVGAFNGLTVEGENLWAGTNDGLVVKMDLNGKLKKQFSFSERGAGVFRMCTDFNKRKWFCQAPREQPILGLAMIDENDQVHYYGKDKGFDNRMLIVKESPRDDLYAAGIGESSYLYKYIPDRDEFVNMSIPMTFPVSPNFEVHDIAIDNQGLVWLATTDGLLRHDMENIIRPNLGPEYTGKEVRAVAVLEDQSIWISTDIYGMLRYKDGNVLSLGEDAGLPTKIMAYRGLLTDQDQKLWINTLEGLTFTSQNPPIPIPSKQPILTNISYKKKTLDSETYEYDLVSGGEVEMEFISLTYPGEFTQYQMALDYDGDEITWNFLSSNSANIEITNTKLKGIKLRARKAGGYDWSDPTNIKFQVKRPWYKRTSYIVLFSLLGLVGIVLLIRANNKRFRRKILELETVLRSRSKEAKTNPVENKFSTHVKKDEEPKDSKDLLRGSLDMLNEIMERTEKGMKWDHILDHLTMALMKIPNTVAFEISVFDKSSNTFEIEGYSHQKHGFYKREEKWLQRESIYTETVKSQITKIVSAEQIEDKSWSKWTGSCETIITAPFKMTERRLAVLALFGNKELKDKSALRAINAVANYLELIV